jgi:deoxycytidine triphosphate deaminase
LEVEIHMSLLNPKMVVEQNWVRNLTNEACVQMNGVELTADEVFLLEDTGWVLSEGGKKHRRLTKVEPIAKLEDGTLAWELLPGRSYDIQSKVYVAIPEDVAMTIHIRSTLNRAGVRVSAGVYDSGFENYAGCVLTNSDTPGLLGVGTRIAQMLFWDASANGKYSGSYQGSEASKHWSASQ